MSQDSDNDSTSYENIYEDDSSEGSSMENDDQIEENNPFVWKTIFEKDIDDIHLVEQGVDQYLFARIDKELEGFKDNIMQAMELIGNQTPSSSELFCFWLREYCIKIFDHVNAQEGIKFSYMDIVKFVHFEIAAAMYKTSPTRIFKYPKSYADAASILPESQYRGLLRRLSTPKYKQVDYTFDKGIDEIERFMSKKCRVCFVPEETIIALDDDKLSGNPRTLKKLELVCKKVKKNWGSINHSAVSVLTGLYMGGLLEKRGRSVAETVQFLCDDLVDTRRGEQTILRNLITIDRGYNSKAISDMCIRAQARELGNRRRETNFPFTFCRKPVQSQERIEEANHFVARWASVEVDSGSESLSGIAWRCNGRVTLLQTSEKVMGKFAWTYDIASSAPSPVANWVPKSEAMQLITRDLIHEVRSGIMELTQVQSTPEWFLLRRFRITSSACGKIMTKWFGEGIVDCVTGLSTSAKRCINESKSIVCDIIGFNQERSVSSSTQDKVALLDSMSREDLVAICEQHKDLLKSRYDWVVGNKKKDQIVEALSKCNEMDLGVHNTLSVSFQQLLHDTWFMSPFRARCMDQGKSNEDVLIQHLPQFLERNSPYEVQTIQLLGLFTDPSNPWIASSVDGLMILTSKTANSSSNSNAFAAFIEIKTRSARATEGEISRINTINGTQNFYEVDIEKDKSLFHKVVPNRDYRAQVIHHAVTGKVNRVLYVESTSRKIVYVVMCIIPDSVIFAVREAFLTPVYLEFIKPLLQKLQTRYTAKTNILDEMNVEPGYAGDELTFRQAYLLAEKLFAKVKRQGTPLEPASKIRPFAVGAWSRLKGGVDVHNRLIANTHSCLHETTPFIGKYMLRNLFRLLMNCHLTIRIFQISKHGDASTPIRSRFPSFRACKQRLNTTMHTFDDFLYNAVHVYVPDLSKWMENKLKRAAEDDVSPHLRPVTRAPKRLGGGSTSRQQRDIWNSGSLCSFRQLSSCNNHFKCNTSNYTKQSKDGAARKDPKRCIVCCELCCSGKHGNAKSTKGRKGCRTTTGCCECTMEAQRGSSFHTDVLALCQFNRFANFSGNEFDVYRDLTCWEIHHSTLPYPPLPCLKPCTHLQATNEDS